MDGYTVIDLETTGFSPRLHDRVVEIGVVHVSATGAIGPEWTTLINPGRDVGPTRVHGISARDILGAPTFGEVAPQLVESLAGRVPVAHNAAFDMRFLCAELARAGVPITERHVSALCTMTWSSTFVRSGSRRLSACCQAAGIIHQDAHSALGDARATAALLAFYLRCAGVPPPWTELITRCGGLTWPRRDGVSPPIRLAHRPMPASMASPDAWLDRLVVQMPHVPDPPQADAYLAVLDSALLDRQLSAHEQEALLALAAEFGLRRGAVMQLHRDYLRALGALALADGVVTVDERDELNLVARLLGLGDSDVDAALAAGSVSAANVRPAFALRPGDRVVLTGDMEVPREVWTTRAEAAGLVVGGVNKKTRLVVAADPDSLSGKAAKARGYGITIVGETAFERLLDEMGGSGRTSAET